MVQPVGIALVGPPVAAQRIRARTWLSAAVAVLLFLANAGLRFPGEMNPDSAWQYQQALSGHYNDWHPPVMAHLWRLFMALGPGTGTMFLFQVALYWAGFGLIAVALVRQGRVAGGWGVLLLAAFPPFLMMNINIHKDVGLAAALLFAFAVLFRSRAAGAAPGALAWGVGLAALAYALLVRANGPFAAAPVLLYALRPALCARPKTFLAASLALALAALPVSGLVNRAVFDARPAHALRSLQVFDLMGIAALSGDATVFAAPEIDARRLAGCYSPVIADTAYHAGRCGFIWDRVAVAGPTDGRMEDEAPNPALTRLWLGAIAAHPLAYVEHRLLHLNSELAFLVSGRNNTIGHAIEIAYGTPAPEVGQGFRKLMHLVRFNPLSAPILWLVVGLYGVAVFAGFGPAPRDRFDRAALALLVSGCVYMLMYAVFGVASDLRYHFWGMLAVGVGIALAAPTLRARWRRPSRFDWAALSVAAAVLAATTACRILL